MFGSFLPSLLVGFSTTNSTRAWEPTLSWNQLHLPTEKQLSSIDVDGAFRLGPQLSGVLLLCRLWGA